MKLIKNNIYQGDCLDLMSYIADGSVDLICADLPFGITANHWEQRLLV